ncbi:MAG: YebC/PmpR family DNA-binding transcriptional regulator [bacterium]|nr:YebC/PmpR family DNA-binding transcriptional regulator [bacterium]
MSGHNKWSQIKDRKGEQDAKRSLSYSKLLAVIALHAKLDPNPDTNLKLRSAIERARAGNVPLDNINRAINKASEAKDLTEVTIEAYGPEGVGIIIEAITDNSNRTVSEIRHLLDEKGAKMATQGSVMWSFDPPAGGNGEWKAKFTQAMTPEGKTKLLSIKEALGEHNDVQNVMTNEQL